MDVKIFPSPLSGIIKNPVTSKSEAHRALFASFLSDEETTVVLNGISDDITATAFALSALGRRCEAGNGYIRFKEITDFKSTVNVGESGTTLRFILPLIGLSGKEIKIETEGRLLSRPVSELSSQLAEHGMKISAADNGYHVSGKLTPGKFTLPGNISSQYISALLITLPCLEEDSIVEVTGKISSRPYIDLTLNILSDFGITVTEINNTFYIPGNQKYHLAKKEYRINADRSQAAFFISAAAIGGDGIKINNFDLCPPLGDGKIVEDIRKFGAGTLLDQVDRTVEIKKSSLNGIEIDADDTPDIIPVLSVVGAFSQGTTIIHGVDRLKYKESDRLMAVKNLLKSIGIESRYDNNSLSIFGGAPHGGGKIDGYNDHRIVMSAAVAGAYLDSPIIISDAEAINKSYPSFFEDFSALCGKFEYRS